MDINNLAIQWLNNVNANSWYTLPISAIKTNILVGCPNGSGNTAHFVAETNLTAVKPHTVLHTGGQVTDACKCIIITV